MGLFSKKYKFTNKKISKGGIMSSLFAVVAIALVVAGIYISYKADGEAGSMVGIFGIFSFITATIGFIIGVRSFKNDEAFLGLPWFGVITNSVIWLFMMCVIFIGI